MISGFDYGTSNCAIGVMQQDDVQLLPLAEKGSAFVPSALYAIERELICESVGLNIPDAQRQQDFIALRANALGQARRIRQQHEISNDEKALFIGEQAFEHYFADPEEGYFVKSPKSFLGASGLRQEFVHFFEDIVTAMMQALKQRAEAITGQAITHTVIGRPVNFQGINAQKSNQQALQIMNVAAQRAGFQHTEFLFEPLAAGMDFEKRLTSNKTVLVVDIGGGTTDCSVVRMGPDHIGRLDREDDFLGHSGERIGGNDLDIQLAGSQLMPLFGLGSTLKSGLTCPGQLFWNAVQTNDAAAQGTYNNLHSTEQIQQLLRDAQQPELIQRFINMREEKQNHHVVRSAEQCKIALSDALQHTVDLSYIENSLSCEVTRAAFGEAIIRPQEKMMRLMEEAITQAGCQPDLIYVTGGSAKSPLLRQAIESKLGNVEVVDGDHFGSVAAGLTVWAQRIFA